jgi:outer membrane protein assembly factor BamD
MIRFSKIAAMLTIVLLATSACGFKRKKYENPITKDTQQPDKILFDKSIKDIEKGRYELARLTLNTLINTYDTSEYLAKAKLAIADSWYAKGHTRHGGRGPVQGLHPVLSRDGRAAESRSASATSISA